MSEQYDGDEPTSPRLRVALASDQTMVTETVRVALTDRGLDPIVLRWPTPTVGRRGPGEVVVARRTGPEGARPAGRPRIPLPDAALLLSELRGPAHLDAVRTLVREVPVPWVVLSSSPRGASWGAALEEGADSVLSIRTSIGDVVEVLLGAASGRGAMTDEERQELVDAWRRTTDETARRRTCFESLTRREREVLEALDAGDQVRSIARAAGVSETTVRSQVRAILRKLGVSSQLAAVAVLRDLRAAALPTAG